MRVRRRAKSSVRSTRLSRSAMAGSLRCVQAGTGRTRRAENHGSTSVARSACCAREPQPSVLARRRRRRGRGRRRDPRRLGRGSDSKGDKTAFDRVDPGAGERSFLAGVPQHGDTLGSPTLRRHLTVYEDPQCPFCRDWALETLPSVVENYVRPGRVKLVYRGVQIIGPNSQEGLRAIYAAGRQNKLWNRRRRALPAAGHREQRLDHPRGDREAAASVGANAALDQGGRRHGAAVTAELYGRRPARRGRPRPGHADLRAPARRPSLPQQLQMTALDPATFESELAAACSEQRGAGLRRAIAPAALAGARSRRT